MNARTTLLIAAGIAVAAAIGSGCNLNLGTGFDLYHFEPGDPVPVSLTVEVRPDTLRLASGQRGQATIEISVYDQFAAPLQSVFVNAAKDDTLGDIDGSEERGGYTNWLGNIEFTYHVASSGWNNPTIVTIWAHCWNFSRQHRIVVYREET